MVKISVIINALDEEAYLWRCLKSLKKQTFQDFEVIVVDAGSNDRTVEVARKMGARILHEPGLGVNAMARNFGASEAKGEIVAFTDAGSICGPTWIKRIADDFSDQKVVALGGPVKPVIRNLMHRVLFRIFNYAFPWVASKFGFYAFHGANLAFRKSTFDKVGGFMENLVFIEDNELPNRIREYGKVLFDRKLTVLISVKNFEKSGYLYVGRKCLEEYWKVYFSRK